MIKGEARKLRTVACPQCGAIAPWDPANPYRPFCSERCKLIDLGQWATDSYRIPEEEANSGPGNTEESR